MSYRQPDPPPVRTVPYGRFWPKPLALIVPLVLLVAAALLVAVGLSSSKRFECQRETGTVVCVYESRLFGSEQRRELSGSQLASVEWVPFRGSKGQERGRTEVFDPDGRPLSVMEGSRERAHAEHERLQRFLSDPAQQSFVWSTSPSAWLLVVAILLFGAGVGFLYRSGREPTSVSLLIDAGSSQVEVRTRYLGVFTRRARHSLANLTRIEVERLQRGDGRRRRAEKVARICLEYETEPSAPLTAWLPDGALHDRVANELRLETGKSPESTEQPVEEPAPASAPKRNHGWVFKWWLSSVVVISVVGFGIQFVVSRDQGTLEIHCDRRCRFQGMDCRPGGSVAGSYDPGQYTIEVFDPQAPNGWRPEIASVERSKTTVFRCR